MAFSWTLRPGGDPLGWYTARNNATASAALRFDSSGTGTCFSLRWPGHGPINPRREQRVLLFEWPTPHRARYGRILVVVATPVCFAALDGGLGLVRLYHAVLMSSSIFSDGFL